MYTILRQGDIEASSAYKIQNTFGLHETVVFTFEGLGVSAFAAFLWFGHLIGMLLGLGVAFVGVALLFAHLGHPWRAWRALAGLGSSWISRGTAFVGGFFLLAVVYLALQQLALMSESLDLALKVALLILACLVLLYPGYVLAQSPSIPFWHSHWLPFLFAASGVTSGLFWCVTYLAYHQTPFATPWVRWLVDVEMLALVAVLVMTVVYIGNKASLRGAAAESARQLLRGRGVIDLAGVGLVSGVLLPLLGLLAMVLDGQLWFAFALICAVAKTLGDLFLRWSIMRVGMYDPVL